MFRLSAKARMAMGMATLVVTMLLVLNMAGLLPDHRKTAMWGRCAISELVALQIRPVILQRDIHRMEGLLESVVERNDEILSGAIRRRDGELIAVVGDHQALWDTTVEVSDDRQVYVPLHAGGADWGRVEICYKPLVRRGWMGMLDQPSNRLVIMMGLFSWLVFYLYLRKMLNHIDPTGAVPGRVRNALDTLGDGLLVIDRRSKIVLANRSLAESINRTPQQMVGMEASELPWALTGEEKEFPWTRVLKSGQSVLGEIIAYKRGGRDDAIFQVSCSPVIGSGGAAQGVLISLDDVSELERTKQQLSEAKESAEAANEAKTSFLANMSHEIRTPMNAILGFTEVLRRDIEQDEGKRQKHLNTIHSSGTHLLNLINDILDLSKVEAGGLEVEQIDCAAHQVVADVITVMNVRAEEKGIWLDYQFESDIPATIQSDPARIRQILTNLVGNAIKFTEKGGVRVITKFQIEHGQNQIVFQVVDTGIGMTQEAANKIFDPFSQADATVTRRFGGTGLGLSISKRFAEALGGGIVVHSEPGVGSVFVVTVDAGAIDGVAMIRPTDEDLQVAEEEAGPLSVKLPELNVLLVDDGDENRDLLGLILTEIGAKYESAINGVEAIELATSKAFDVVLMDMQMPVMDGYTATRKLREMGYDRPIVALTAHAMYEAEDQCLDAGCSGFLSKPIEFDKLIATLSEVAGVAAGSTNVEAAPSAPSAKSAKSNGTEIGVSGNACAEQRTDASNAPSNECEASSPIRSMLAERGSTFQSIVQEFVGRLPMKVSEMSVALDHGDFKQLADLAHWLKGSGPNVGLMELMEPAKQLEHHARDGKTADAGKRIEQIRSMLPRIEIGGVRPLAEVILPGDTNTQSEAPAASPSPKTEQPHQTEVPSVNQSNPSDSEPVFSTLPIEKPKFREIVVRFVDQLDARFEVIETALAANDSQQLIDLAHALKGSAASCGFSSLATLAGTIERSSRDEDFDLIPEILRELRDVRGRIEIPESRSEA